MVRTAILSMWVLTGLGTVANAEPPPPPSPALAPPPMRRPIRPLRPSVVDDAPALPIDSWLQCERRVAAIDLPPCYNAITDGKAWPVRIPTPVDVFATPAVTMGALTILGALDRPVLVGVLKTGLHDFSVCAGRELSETATGEVLLRATISGDGSVAMVQVRETSFSSPPIETCLVDRVSSMQFPEPRGGGVVIFSVPLVFALH